MGKKWTLKIAQITPANNEQAGQSSNPTQTNPPEDEIKKLMSNPGHVFTFGEGQPLFKRPLTGKEQLGFALVPLTPQKVFNSIKTSLEKNGFKDNTKYTPEQLNFFKLKLQQDLASEYGEILSLLNEAVFK